MASTRSLKGISRSLGETFVSRNNDLDGYWGIGLLCQEAQRLGVPSSRLDLLSGTSEPCAPLSQALAAIYATVLAELIDGAKIQKSQLSSATIEVYFGTFGACTKPYWRLRGDPYYCAVRLAACTGKLYGSTIAGYCSPHNPNLEFRSTRAERSNNSFKPNPLRGSA